MKINDYEFIYNIDALFEKKLIIYGAGMDGRRLYDILREIPVNVECFCNKHPDKKPTMSIPVISNHELYKKTKNQNYFIIIGSNDYCDEIILDLENMQIQAYVCTCVAVRVGIELHIGEKLFSDKFRNDFKNRREVWNQMRVPYHEYNACLKMSVYPHAIMIYQVGKVGSSTLSRTFDYENITSVHVHHLMQKIGIPQVDSCVPYLKNKIREDGVKIISLVREPIARALSEFMQGIHKEYTFIDRCSSSDIEVEACKWVKDSLEKNEEFEWFDYEMKELTGIDVYQYPFDREKGYVWIQQGKIEVLLLKLEKLNENVDKIGKFVGKPGIGLLTDNTGDGKSTKYIYSKLKKNFKLPADVVKKQYENNPKFDHFYTENEKKYFLEKWKFNIL